MINTELNRKKAIKSNKIIKRIKVIISIMIIFILLIFMPYPFLYMNSYGNNFNNSIYSTEFYKNKNVMIIVPHQDDEINVAGATIKNYVDGGSEVTVVFTTNGDYYGLGEIRINEAINAVGKLGVKPENVVFLGYGDKWNTEYNHIYHAPDNEIITSGIGNLKSYGTDEIQTFREMVSGNQSLYTRKNYKSDIRDVILHYSPDIIFSVDFDLHIDHRATSLLFEEVIGEILKEYEDYEPKVFKGFAYNTAWFAINDFYSINLKSTAIPNKNDIINEDYELDTPNYNWKDRVRFLVPNEMLSYTKRSNLLYEALSKHKSQNANLKTTKIANSDQVFWERNTNSITYNSEIKASSGNSNYINDFKLIDSTDISEYEVVFNNCVWTQEDNDLEKSLNITLGNPSDIYSISIYDNPSLNDNITKGVLRFSDGSEIYVKDLMINGSETIIDFPKKSNIEYIEFKILEYEGDNPGLCELEVFDTDRGDDIQYIKLIVDDEEENFLYRYMVSDGETIPINIYSYPNTQNKISLDDCNISIIKGDENISIQDNTLKIAEGVKPGEYKIRVEMNDNELIFDEVEIVIPNLIERIYYGFITMYERIFDRICVSLRYRLGLLE